jgi:ankyrin repeat protein
MGLLISHAAAAHDFIEGIAAHGDAAEVAAALADNKSLVEATDEDSNTPLLAAAHMGHASIVKLLLQRGARVNHSNASSGWTALHAAAARGHDDVVVLLLRNGADKSSGEPRHAC